MPYGEMVISYFRPPAEEAAKKRCVAAEKREEEHGSEHGVLLCVAVKRQSLDANPLNLLFRNTPHAAESNGFYAALPESASDGFRVIIQDCRNLFGGEHLFANRCSNFTHASTET